MSLLTRSMFRKIQKLITKARCLGRHHAVAHLKAAAWYLANETNTTSERIERLTTEELEIASRGEHRIPT